MAGPKGGGGELETFGREAEHKSLLPSTTTGLAAGGPPPSVQTGRRVRPPPSPRPVCEGAHFCHGCSGREASPGGSSHRKLALPKRDMTTEALSPPSHLKRPSPVSAKQTEKRGQESE